MKVDTTENVEIKIKDNEQYNNSQLKGFFTSYLAYCIIVTVFGGTLAVGWNIGEFNTPSQTLKRFFTQSYAERYNKNMTDDTLLLLWSTANGIMPLGGAFGGLFTGLSVEKFGHIHSMMLINVIVVINAVLYFISKYIKSYETLIVGRVLTGFVSGFFCGVCPLYLSEIPPVNLRGLSGTINALAMCIGNLLTNILGLPSILGTDSLWNVLLVLIVVPAIVHYVGLLFCVESPKYLYVTKNNRDKAKYALLKLRGEDQTELIENELAQLDEEKSETANQSNIPYTDLINKPNLRRALIVSIMLQASQQFSGIIVVSFYSADIFISLGLDSKTWAVYATIMVAFVETVMHGFTAVFIDKWGRRILLIVGMLGMSFSCFVLAITRIFSDQVEWFKIVAVVITVTYIIFYSIGPGPIPLLVTAELFDTKTRGKAVSIAVFLNWFFNFVVTITFPFIDDAIGGYSFIIYGVLLILFCIFTFFKVPETKNKPINEILKYFD